MRDRHPDSAVIWTDCCSNPVPLPRTTKRPAAQKPTVVQPVMRNLLFQHRGVVDVTGSTEASYGDDDNGGIFTRTLAGLIMGDIKQYDKNHDGFVSRQEFYPILEDETEQTFKRWAKQMRARGESVTQSTQRPRKFDLPDPMSEAGKDIANAVIGLRNAGSVAVAYQFRWTGDKNWKKGALEPGKTGVHFTPMADAKDNLPTFELQFEGEKDTLQLQPRLWVGRGSPAYAAAKKYKVESDTKSRNAEPVPATGDNRNR